MLVLTRRVGEKIVIDDTIVVTVTAVRGDRVRLGVAAPASVPVDRLEIHERRVGNGRARTPSAPPGSEGG